MIESIHIAGIATYSGTPEVLNDLSQFNFVYGSNGSGKTTITKVIADEDRFPSCHVVWKGGTKLRTMVYNRDFVDKNFNQTAELKGIFTLGEKNVDIIKKIAIAKGELDAHTKKIEALNRELAGEDDTGGKKGELAVLEQDFKTKCWIQKKKHDAKLFGAFGGFRNNSENFKAKVLQEKALNTATLEPLADLEHKAETVFGPTPSAEQSITPLDIDTIVGYESCAILNKRVIGKEDVDIAAMIKKLGNSDWVRGGRAFFEANGRLCPFCQQSTTEAFALSLNEYFDATFETDTKAINDLVTNYKTESDRLLLQIASIMSIPSKYLDVEKLIAEKELLKTKVTVNIQQLDSKKKEPSRIVELESVTNVVALVKDLIDAANVQIQKHNTIVANLSKERQDLAAQVWKYLLEVELKTDIVDYDKKRIALNKAIDSISEKIRSTMNDKNAKVTEIHALEKDTTSIQPTINGINDLLKAFGFNGFTLAKADKGSFYKLIRADGSDAKETLSEGETSFVTFLYFYHLLKGSNSDTGMTADRIVVFDDPVSSLDSDILFIVGSLIKGLFDDVRKRIGHIKQIFVFTHNVYFHKEVTFNPNRRDVAKRKETFWVVRKSDLVSKIEKHESNPIKTSYDLLWSEVRRQDRSKLTIQNTLRRILENYFKIMGGIDSDDICDMFNGREKIICKSFFSWVNDGSHFAHDDLYVSIDDSMADACLMVFKEIFVKSKHIAHYNMMMGITDAEELIDTPSSSE